MEYEVFRKEGIGTPVVWIGLENLEEVTIPNPVIGVTISDWNRYLSPWKSQKVFAKGEDFGGEAQAFLTVLLDEIMPTVDTADGCILCGYSLAGLFALWTTYQTSMFTACVCASGSLWFEGWLEYANTHQPQSTYYYLSLGDKEKNTKNPRMRFVEDNTREMVRILAQKKETQMEMNPGNHFTDVVKRCEKGITSCEKMCKK